MEKYSGKVLVLEKEKGIADFFVRFLYSSLAQGLLYLKAPGHQPMASSSRSTRKREYPFTWGMVLLLTVHFLSLCTISSAVHADLILQAVSTQHTTVGHCSFPSAARQTARPLSADHKKTRRPVCCDLERTHKADRTSPILAVSSLLPALASLLRDTDARVWDVTLLHPIHTLPSSHSPPLYLLHTALLI